jgi:hypothetical protein
MSSSVQLRRFDGAPSIPGMPPTSNMRLHCTMCRDMPGAEVTVGALQIKSRPKAAFRFNVNLAD